MTFDKASNEVYSRIGLVVVLFGFTNMILANTLFWKILALIGALIVSAIYAILPYFFYLLEDEE